MQEGRRSRRRFKNVSFLRVDLDNLLARRIYRSLSHSTPESRKTVVIMWEKSSKDDDEEEEELVGGKFSDIMSTSR